MVQEGPSVLTADHHLFMSYAIAVTITSDTEVNMVRTSIFIVLSIFIMIIAIDLQMLVLLLAFVIATSAVATAVAAALATAITTTMITTRMITSVMYCCLHSPPMSTAARPRMFLRPGLRRLRPRAGLGTRTAL